MSGEGVNSKEAGEETNSKELRKGEDIEKTDEEVDVEDPIEGTFSTEGPASANDGAQNKEKESEKSDVEE